MLSYSSSLCFLWWYVFALGSLNHHITVPLRIRLYLSSVCFIFCLPSQAICPSILSVCLSIWCSIRSISSLSVYPPIQSIHPVHSIFVSRLSIRPFYLQSVYHPAYVSTHPSIHPVCLAIHPVCVSIHLSIQSVSLSIFHVYNVSSICIYVCAQSCLTHFNHVNYSPPGSSVHGISQARILEWVAMPSSRGSSRCRDQACVSCVYCIKSEFLPHWAIQAIYLPFLSSMCLWSFICPSCSPSYIYISIVYHLSSLPSPIYPWSVYLLSTYHLFIYFLCIICVCLSIHLSMCLSIICVYLLSKIDFFIIYHLFISMYLLCICLSMKLKFEAVSRSVVCYSLWPHGM